MAGSSGDGTRMKNNLSGEGSIPISSLSLPTANTARQHLGTKKKSDTKQVHPGYSMFEWNKLCHSGQDMTGTGGRLLKVTPDELARHCSDTDLWTSVRGVVYNVTQFNKYHPGGKAQLMRGAGKDCTELFDKIHVWVNSEAILKECIVGALVGTKRKHEPLNTTSLMVGATKPAFPVDSSTDGGGDVGETVLSLQVPALALQNVSTDNSNSQEDTTLVLRSDDTSTTPADQSSNPDVQVSIPIPTSSTEHVTGKSSTVTVSTPSTQVSIPVPTIDTITNSDVQVSVPVPTIGTITKLTPSTEVSIPVPTIDTITNSDVQVSIPVPTIGTIKNADIQVSVPVPTISTDIQSVPVPTIDTVTSSNIQASIPIPNIGTVMNSVSDTQVSIPVPTIGTVTNSTSESQTSIPVHVFRTNIRGNYISKHPLISKTAYESEV